MTYIAPHEYVEYAPSMVGGQVHINHASCSAGIDRKKRLYIKRNESTIVAYCHNCGGKGIYHITKSGSTRSLTSLKKELKEKEHKIVKKVVFPKDVTFDTHEFSTKALAWLFKYNVTVSLITKHKICYSKSMDRVILPVFDDKGELVFWQGRALAEGVYPKYLSCSSAEKPFMFLRTTNPDKNNVWVIVEDVLSAIRCSEVCNSIALLGTVPTTKMALVLKKENPSKVFLWLDNDNAGWFGKQKCNQLLSLLLDDVHTVHHPSQPKECSVVTLTEVLL